MDGERAAAPSGECLRQRHPGFVPIVCLGEAAGSADERPVRLKLMVRATYTISQLKRDISWRLPEAPVDRLWLGRELAQDDAELVSAVDARQRAEEQRTRRPRSPASPRTEARRAAAWPCSTSPTGTRTTSAAATPPPGTTTTTSPTGSGRSTPAACP
ncbi:unnamed protein product [Prorocentrum cordatum]|uniref:Ubiquitin-like domain-containing protein n=1 Tax=Prorocentrum cordatum TaxID=2364126 RepID=A0ABN9UHX4_9DINO|nr:unnamed protein product [Polarella glacialis]